MIFSTGTRFFRPILRCTQIFFRELLPDFSRPFPRADALAQHIKIPFFLQAETFQKTRARIILIQSLDTLRMQCCGLLTEHREFIQDLGSRSRPPCEMVCSACGCLRWKAPNLGISPFNQSRPCAMVALVRSHSNNDSCLATRCSCATNLFFISTFFTRPLQLNKSNQLVTNTHKAGTMAQQACCW